MVNVNKKQSEIQICQIRPNSPNLQNAIFWQMQVWQVLILHKKGFLANESTHKNKKNVASTQTRKICARVAIC
jgi:hypothetical protein